MIAIRHKYDDLHGNGELEFNYEEGKIPFFYKRGKLVMFLNPLGESAEIATTYSGKTIYQLGNAEFADGKVNLAPQSFVMIEI
jgi:maltose alpha-D-glucosyltransferase/alpha-amylase